MPRNGWGRIVCMIASIGLVSANTAIADTMLYALRYNGDLLSVNKQSGQAQFVGNCGFGTNAAASDSLNRIFSIDSDAQDRLIQIDPETGAGSIVLGVAHLAGYPNYGPRGIAFDSNDNLYVTLGRQPGDPGLLATVDMQAGQYALVGETGVVLQGLAFGPDDNLYGMSVGDEGTLYTLDTATGDATLIGGSAIWPDNQTIEFDTDGTLFCARHNLKTLDPATGAATLIGPTGFDDIRGLAIIPEPATLSCLALGVLLATTRRR